MPVIILTNVCNLLGIINRAITIVYEIIPHFNNMLTYIKVNLITNLNSQI